VEPGDAGHGAGARSPEGERFDRVQAIFHAAVDLPVEAQAKFVATACGDDVELRRAVTRMLAADSVNDSPVDGDASRLAAMLLGDRANAPLPPHNFGPYRAVRVLGEGGMGVVYLGERSDLQSVAAIKILRDAWASMARRERFLTEQRTLAQLNHPAIAHLIDAGSLADGTPWIAMEYVDGKSLTDHCRENHSPLRQRLQLVRAVCEAVLHAHQHLVIHRDIKPSNVLVRADGTVKLLDFGIAKQLEPAHAAVDATRTGLRLMTPAYAAPEQVRGERVGVHTDVYSLGVLLYELLAGTVPFDLSDRTPAEAEAIITGEDPVKPSQRARTTGGRGTSASLAQWGDLDVLCLTAMHKDPARRYRSVDAFIRDIDHFLGGAPLDAHPDSVGYRVAAFARRNARAVTSVAVGVVALVALVTFYTVRLAQARDEARQESVRAQRIQRFMSSLFQGGDEAAGPAESLRVVTLLDKGVVEARGLDAEPAVQADLYATLGGIYRQLGVYDRADSLLGVGVARWRTLAGEESPEAARAQVALGDLRTDQARYDDAEQLLRAGMATLRRTRPADDPGIADAGIALGRSITERGEHERAIAVLDSVVSELRLRDSASTQLVDGLEELASAHFYAGNYDVADSLNRDVLALTKRLFGERHPRVANDLMNLGATEQERGNTAASERYFREALALTTAFYGENHILTAGNLVYLGRSLLVQNRYAESRGFFERSLAIRERVFGPLHPSVANTLNEIGSLAIRESQYEDAERTYARVLDIYRRAYPPTNYRIGVATGNLADTYLYRKDYRRAEPLYRQALEIYIASQGAEHINTGIGYLKLGRCLMRSGRFKEAVPQTERGYAIVGKVAAPENGFMQAARLDLSIALDSLGRREEAARYKAEREKYLSK